MSIKNIQLVELDDLGLESNTFDVVSEFFEGATYDRYYPDPEWDYLDADVKAEMNEKLLLAGAVFPDNDPLFYILLRFEF